jgi:NAD(P)-dependent dehydrogenase (short-subunit alcohol dehydrogenase family)
MTRIAIVTGGGSGIGAATCRLLARDGWAIAINYRSHKEAAHELANEIERRGGCAIPISADIAVDDDVRRLFDTTEERLGPITGLVNNAGVVGERKRFSDGDFSIMRDVIAVNVLGTMACAHEAVRRMSTAGGGAGGVIVNISSGLSKTGGALAVTPVFRPDPEGRPSGGRVAYATSKGAINALSIALAQEVAREGIRVNTVSPGATRTGIVDPLVVAEMAEDIPVGRFAEPEEIAEAISWLMSDRASYVTGAYLRVGGGRLG